MQLSLRGIGLVALGATAGSCASYLLTRKREKPISGYKTSTDHPSFKFGAPVGDVLRVFDGYTASYDTRLRNPRWVLERMTKESSKGDGNRTNATFLEDQDIDAKLRAKLSDFQGSGYDRGHMTPAANHKGSQDNMADTFVLTNISPQVGKGFNRDYWARFERFVKTIADTSVEEVYVVTGPLYVANKNPAGGWAMAHPMIGQPPGLVAVPTHFFKVILGEKSRVLGGKQLIVAAFVMPNKEIDPETPLSAFVVPLDALETVAGLKFFPEGLSDPARRRPLEDAALKWQEAGRTGLKGKRHGELMLLENRPTRSSSSNSLSSSNSGLLEQDSTSTGENVGAVKPVRRRRRRKSDGNAAPEEAPTFLQSVAGSLGSAHLCDHMACKLPPTDWYKSQKRLQQP